MPINFIPRRGAILMCDFDMARVPPEIDKVRRIVVVSPTRVNHRHANCAGLCVVVPLSITEPNSIDKRCILIPKGRYRSITEDVLAKVGSITTVSHDRLDRPYVNRRYHTEYFTDTDMALIEVAVAASTGIDRESEKELATAQPSNP